VTASLRSAARLALAGLTAAVALLVVGQAGAAQSHAFTASYSGTGSGQVSGKNAFGRAALSGRGRPVGRGTLSGSATGTFTSATCVAFSGKATLKGPRGSLRLAASRAQACASGGGSDRVFFSGRARIVGGTSAFAGAEGIVSFSGTYVRSTSAVSVSFRGRIAY
jgi:hypothetical protein